MGSGEWGPQIAPPEVGVGDVGDVLDPAKKGKVTASQTTVGPGLSMKQYS